MRAVDSGLSDIVLTGLRFRSVHAVSDVNYKRQSSSLQRFSLGTYIEFCDVWDVNNT